jgi:hypothetical protein
MYICMLVSLYCNTLISLSSFAQCGENKLSMEVEETGVPAQYHPWTTGLLLHGLTGLIMGTQCSDSVPSFHFKGCYYLGEYKKSL